MTQPGQPNWKVPRECREGLWVGAQPQRRRARAPAVAGRLLRDNRTGSAARAGMPLRSKTDPAPWVEEGSLSPRPIAPGTSCLFSALALRNHPGRVSRSCFTRVVFPGENPNPGGSCTGSQSSSEVQARLEGRPLGPSECVSKSGDRLFGADCDSANELAIQPGDILDRDADRASRFAFVRVRAVAEPFLVHLGDHPLDTAHSLRGPLGQ